MDDKDLEIDKIIDSVNKNHGNEEKAKADIHIDEDKTVSDNISLEIKNITEMENELIDSASSSLEDIKLEVEASKQPDKELDEIVIDSDNDTKKDDVLHSEQTPDLSFANPVRSAKPKSVGKTEMNDELNNAVLEDENKAPEQSKPEDLIKNKKSSKKTSKKKAKKKSSKVNNSIFVGLIVIVIILTVSLIIAVTGIKLGKDYLGIGKNSDEITFNIPDDASSDDIIQLLVDNNIIESPKLFTLYLKINGSTLYPGDVTLQPSMNYSQIVATLASTRQSYETVTVTFQEGLTLLDVAKLLEENKVCTASDFLFEFNRNQDHDFEKLMVDTDMTFYKMEGFCFPDTYEFYVEDTAYNVAKIIKDHFDVVFTDDMLKKMQDQDLTINELMTLASIVQMEAGTVEDMTKVASVFLNRLADSDTFPLLQSDATGNYIDKVIKVAADNDLSINTYSESYDTYTWEGLPAGPISNPGLDAINAVLNPADTQYYYFCNNLETGEAFYAETLEQHEKNLIKAGLAS